MLNRGITLCGWPAGVEFGVDTLIELDWLENIVALGGVLEQYRIVGDSTETLVRH